MNTSVHLEEEPVEPARGLPWGFSAVAPASPSCAPPPLRYLCQRRGSGSASRAGSGCAWRQTPIRSRCVCLSARQELLVVGFVGFFFRVQVAVLPPSMLNSERSKSGSQRPLGNAGPFILQGRRRLSNSGAAGEHRKREAEPWAAGWGTSGTGAAVIPAPLREGKPEGENAPHLGLKLLPGAGQGSRSSVPLHSPPFPALWGGGGRQQKQIPHLSEKGNTTSSPATCKFSSLKENTREGIGAESSYFSEERRHSSA